MHIHVIIVRRSLSAVSSRPDSWQQPANAGRNDEEAHCKCDEKFHEPGPIIRVDVKQLFDPLHGVGLGI